MSLHAFYAKIFKTSQNDTCSDCYSVYYLIIVTTVMILFSLEYVVSVVSGEENFSLLNNLLSLTKATLKRNDIHDANRGMLSLVIEGLLGKFDVKNKVRTRSAWTAEGPTLFNTANYEITGRLHSFQGRQLRVISSGVYLLHLCSYD